MTAINLKGESKKSNIFKFQFNLSENNKIYF